MKVTGKLTREELLARADEADKDSRWFEAVELYQLLIERSLVQDDTAQHAFVLRRIGVLNINSGELRKAEAALEESRNVAQAAGLHQHHASALNALGIVRQNQGDLDAAEALFNEAEIVARKAGHRRLLTMVNQNLGTIANIRGESEIAMARYRAALTHYEEQNDEQGMTWVLHNLGMVNRQVGRFEDAAHCFDRALSVATDARDSDMMATVQLHRGDLHVQQREYTHARVCADQAFGMFTQLDSKLGIAEASKLYGVLYRELGKLELAESYLAVVTDVARESEFRLLHAESEAEFALVHLASGRNREALQSLNRAHALFGEMKARRELYDIERALDRLEEKYMMVTQVWGESIESKDHYTAGHCSRVAEYATRLAEILGVRGRDLRWLKMGAFLHDVGKTAVDLAILNKPGKLDADEWEQMMRHTTVGDSLVAEMNFPYDIRPIVRNHHERWDGSGYPDRLAGKNIPFTARILCVADVFDALTTSRSYRPAFSAEAALRIMREEAGKVVDPELFATFEDKVVPELDPPVDNK